MTESKELVVTYKPLVIESNIEGLSKHVDEIIKPFLENEIDVSTKEDEQQAKAVLADLKKYGDEIDRRRKEECKKLSEPIAEIDSELKGIVLKISDAYRKCKNVIDEKVDTLKLARREELTKEYLGIVGEEVFKLIPYCVIENPSWCTRSYGEKKAEKELFEKAEKVLGDMKTLEGMDFEYRSEVIACYTSTLDFQKAIAKDQQLKEQKKAADLKAQEAAAAFKLKDPEPEPELVPFEPAPDLAKSDYVIFLTGATIFEAKAVAKYAKNNTAATIELKEKK